MLPRTPGITLIDCDYLRPRFACAYLCIEGERAFFVDNNTAHAVPKMLAALAAAGLTPESVEYLIVTHVHLDHAGGTSALLRACPNATVLAHPRAVRHLVDPSKLVASARSVYGEARFAELYGEILPIAAARVRAVDEGEEITFGSKKFRFLHTRGHANHHICVAYGEAIFTGDAFGLAYPALQSEGLFIFPSTSPTDFDAREAKRSVHRIRESGAKEALLTHFGAVFDLELAARQLESGIDQSESILDEAGAAGLTGADLEAFCKSEVLRHMHDRLERAGLPLSDSVRELLAIDLDLNGQGLASALQKRSV